jgi:RNA polymerase sigma-70 factor (ECF subfamily)
MTRPGAPRARQEETELLRRASAGQEEAFGDLVASFRAGLQLHCYRMLGSVHDAEDLVQETLLAAWRGLDGFQGHASVRSWLYRIATNRCLNLLRDRGRRPAERPATPGQLVPPPPTRWREPVFLEPYPDVLLNGVLDTTHDPAARYEAREAVGLAFMVALQQLSPRQRAVLVLRDVLAFRASETAQILGTTEVSVNRALHRARQAIERAAPPGGRELAPLPDSAAQRDLMARFATAFEAGDVPGVVALLTGDAVLTMPPEPLEYQGPAAIAGFLSTVPAGGALDRFRLVPTRANGQPAFGCYLRDPHARDAHAYGLMVLTLSSNHVTAITGFADTSVFHFFGLPPTLR